MESKTSKKTKDLICDTFIEMLKDQGYNDIDINEVAKRAKIGIGTVYYQFKKPAKPKIIKRLYERKIIDLFKMLKFSPTEELDFFKLIENQIENYVKFYRENPEFFKAHLQAILSNDDLLKEYKETIENSSEIIVKVLKQNKSLPNTDEKVWIFKFKLFNSVLNALIIRHLFMFPMFDEDEKLVEFIKKIARIIIYEVNE
jgi:AcrR family transcriptional regulator